MAAVNLIQCAALIKIQKRAAMTDSLARPIKYAQWTHQSRLTRPGASEPCCSGCTNWGTRQRSGPLLNSCSCAARWSAWDAAICRHTGGRTPITACAMLIVLKISCHCSPQKDHICMLSRHGALMAIAAINDQNTVCCVLQYHSTPASTTWAGKRRSFSSSQCAGPEGLH